MTDDRAWLQQAIDLAVANVAEGGGPFAALVVRDGEVLGTGRNRVTRDLDPTAHAEVTAIRSACRLAGDFSLVGCTLYTSCEPCPMCLATSLWARLDRVVYAADRNDAARGGFDDRVFHELLGSTRSHDHADWPTRIEELRLPSAAAPFDAWLAKDDRVNY